MEPVREKRGPGIVRQTDIEPYTGLKWVSRLFKAASIFLFVAMLGELVAGLRYDGMRSMPVLLGEAARTFVVAVVLWAGGDLVRLFVHLGHDIRAERILLARLVSRTPAREGEEISTAEEAGASESGPVMESAPEGGPVMESAPEGGLPAESAPEGLPLRERGAAD